MLTRTRKTIATTLVVIAGVGILGSCLSEETPKIETQTVILPDKTFCNAMRQYLPLTFDTGPRGTLAGTAGYDTATTAKAITAANVRFGQLCR